jgi:aspartate/methionine/tyrosine aminotransferase
LQSLDRCIVINSFSKYFAMTGWRIGWMVVPESLVDPIDRIAQNLFLAPPTMAQYAAIAALELANRPELDERREIFRQRRDFLLPALEQTGFSIPLKPQGAFYIYADCSQLTDDSYDWCYRLLEAQAVAVTPGIDFGHYRANHFCRFAYTQPLEVLEQAIDRIDRYIRSSNGT